MTPDKQSFPTAVLEWLRSGYPEGIPPKDRIPLVALLHRQLTSEQIKDAAVALAEAAGELDDPTITRDEIGELIEEVTHSEPSAEDIARVASVLAAAGWPLAGIDRDELYTGDAADAGETTGPTIVNDTDET